MASSQTRKAMTMSTRRTGLDEIVARLQEALGGKSNGPMEEPDRLICEAVINLATFLREVLDRVDAIDRPPTITPANPYSAEPHSNDSLINPLGNSQEGIIGP